MFATDVVAAFTWDGGALRIGGVLGIGERINIGAFLLWVAVLAVALWKRPAAEGASQA